MRPILPFISVLTAAVLLSPVGASTWSAFGSYEPDNTLDTPSYMWQDAPEPGDNRIYFAAFSTTGGTANANVAALETSMEAVTLEYHEAILGVWKDCNGDGYVGMAESALTEYDARLLLDTSVCPAVTDIPTTWVAGAHNYNRWVSELIPIGGIDSDPNETGNARVYRDREAMVWGDYGRPTDGASAGGTCALNPLPRGTLSSTGGIINYLGCPYPGVKARWDEVILGRDVAGEPFGGLQSIDPLFAQFAFGPDARNSWADMDTLGSEDSSHAAVKVIDCSGPPLVHSGDTYNLTGRPLDPVWVALGAGNGSSYENISFSNVAPGFTGSPDPTVAGQNNQTTEEVFEDCDTSNDSGHDTYGILEGDFNGVSTTRKTEADWNFQFDDSARGSPWGLVLGSNGQGGTSNYWGIGPVQHTTGVGLNMWFSDSQLVKRGPRTAAVDTYEGTVNIADPAYFSFYAHVGSAGSARGTLPGGSGEYGLTQCTGSGGGIQNGWDCDASNWYVNPDGTLIPETYPFARPGQAYELRDVDCYDGANSLDAPTGAPAYGNNPCVRN